MSEEKTFESTDVQLLQQTQPSSDGMFNLIYDYETNFYKREYIDSLIMQAIHIG